MSLIELLFLYKDLVLTNGRENANEYLHSWLDAKYDGGDRSNVLFQEIETTVSDNGEFITGTGKVWDVYRKVKQ